MPLRDVIEPGDLILVYPKKDQWLGTMIRKFTFGEVSHAALVIDKDTLFETDGNMFTAKFTSPDKYEGRHLLIVSSAALQGKEEQLRTVATQYLGAPYSYWDIGTNMAFFWLAAPLRRKIIAILGTKSFMLCSELAARIMYEVGHREELRTYEGVSPEDLREIAFLFPNEYIVTRYNPNNL
jgi:hypothetical protein